MTAKDTYVKMVKGQLDNWDGEIEHIDAKADIMLLQIEEKYYTLLRTLRCKEKAIKTNLQQLDAAGEEDWQSFKSLLDGATSEMEVALFSAMQELSAPHQE